MAQFYFYYYCYLHVDLVLGYLVKTIFLKNIILVTLHFVKGIKVIVRRNIIETIFT